MTKLLTALTGALCLSTALAALPAQAAIMAGDDLVSGTTPADACTTTAAAAGGAGPCTVTPVTAHPAWVPNGTGGLGAVWVSHDATGFGDAVFQPFGGMSPIFSLSHVIDAGVKTAKLAVTVWADDTAEVLLNGVSLFAPNFTQGTCAQGPIGCQPGEGKLFEVLLQPGLNTLTFVTFQTGTGLNTNANPFGLLYSGTTTEVPEPAAVLLVGLSLAGIGAAGALRRMRRAA